MRVRRRIGMLISLLAVANTHGQTDDRPRVAFASTPGGPGDIYVVNLDNGETDPLTDHPRDDWSPSWSPDGRHVAFISSRDGDYYNHMASTDGGDPRRLAAAGVWAIDPAWGPDGKRVAYSQDGDIYTVELATERVARVTNDDADNRAPAWSPDGSEIAYAARARGPKWEDVFLVASTGGPTRNLTNSIWSDRDPTWSPHGTQLAFSSGGS